MQSAPEQTTVTERDKDLGREACAALARATWFAEYLERKFAAVRAEERARCAAIVRRFRLDEHADIMLQEIENG